MFGATPAASWRKTLLRSRTILALSGKCFRNRCMPAAAAAGSDMPLATVLLHRICRLNDHMVQKLPFSLAIECLKRATLAEFIRDRFQYMYCRAKTSKDGRTASDTICQYDLQW